MEEVLKKRPSSTSQEIINGRIIKVLWELKKLGRAEATIRNIRKCLNVLAKYSNLNNPESVLTFVATFERRNGYKRNLIMAYEHYVKLFYLCWTKPKYKEKAKMPRIPKEEHIVQIMAISPLKLRTAIGMSKDTGLRPVELMGLTLRDIDFSKRAIYPETAKYGAPRVLQFSNQTSNILNRYVSTRYLDPKKPIFANWTSDAYGKWFRIYRNKTADKMQNPDIASIRLYDLRHFFATMTYHRTKDILFVKQQMGHRKIDTTLVYTQLLQFEKDDNYHCRVAKSIDEATELVENGFEYVTEIEGLKLFRKRK